MSILSQLENLKASVTNVFDNNIKHKKSLIHTDGSSIGRTQAHENCKKGFLKLCQLYPEFSQFSNLFAEDTIDMVPQLLKEDQFNAIKKQIKLLLCLLAPHLEIPCAINVLEWLVYKFEIHEHQPEDILIACLPYHNDIIFIKLIRLLNLKKKEFLWLSNFAKEGKGFSVMDLSGLCLKYPNLLEMICSWPNQVAEMTESDYEASNKFFFVITDLGVNLLDKVKFMEVSKIEKYLGPFIRLIIDGLYSKHVKFQHCAMTLLTFFSQGISLDRKLSMTACKYILKNPTNDLLQCLKVVVYACHFQRLTLKPKTQALFMDSLNKLNNEERKIINQLMSDKPAPKDESEDHTMVMEVDEVKKERIVVKTEKEIVKEMMVDVKIVWSGSEIEQQLIQLLKTFVLNWVDIELDKNVQMKCKPSKVASSVLRQFKQKPTELTINYKPGGLISHLCLGILYPDPKIKSLVLKLIKKFGSTWPAIADFSTLKSNDIHCNPDCMIYGGHSRIILRELEHICHNDSLTATISCFYIINNSNIDIVPELTNLWKLFLNKLQPNSSEESFIYRNALLKCLSNIKSSYSSLSELHQHEILSKIVLGNNPKTRNDAIEYVTRLSLSVANLTYLLLDPTNSEKKFSKRKSLKKFKNEPDLTPNIFDEKMIDQFIIALSALCRMPSIPAEEQMVLVDPIMLILNKIVNHFSLNKFNASVSDQPCTNENAIELVKTIMLAMLNFFYAIENSTEPLNLESISNKIRLEVFTKCLYLFPNGNLNELNLSVIQNIIKYGLGLEQFNLIYFISWIGNHLVPREDQHSLNILNKIINETLPLCIKQKKENSSDKVQIIIKFINECTNLPKHRALVFYQSLVKSLSGDEGLNSSVLWMQILFMVVTKNTNTGTDNSPAIGSLLSKFHIDEQMFAWKKLIVFITQIIQDPSRKRKLIDYEVTNSPMSKKRKTTMPDTCDSKLISVAHEEQDYLSVRTNLLSVNSKIDTTHLLQSIMLLCLSHLRENTCQLLAASAEVLKDFISSVFTSIRQLSRSNLAVPIQNECSMALRQSIECVGNSLPKNIYLAMLVDLAVNDINSTVKTKCVELLANKFAIMALSKESFVHNSEIRDIVKSMLPMMSAIITKSEDSIDWNSSLLSVTHLIALGFTTEETIEQSVNQICVDLMSKNFTKMSTDKVIITNIFFKNYVDADCYEDLSPLFQCAIAVMDKCITSSMFNTGELESSLALMHAIISREDAHKIGWQLFSNLITRIFDLVTIDIRLKKLSQQSCDYQKQIRLKLSKMSDTAALIDCCKQLLTTGLSKHNLTYISGSISLVGCHFAHLNRIKAKYDPNEVQCETMWQLVYQSLAVNETLDESTDLIGIRELSIKFISQLCHLFDLDSEIIDQLFTWTQKSEQSARFYLDRIAVFYRIISYLVTKSSSNDKIIELVNNSDTLVYASGFLKHLSLETKIKRRKTQSASKIPFSPQQMTSEYPKQSAQAIISICDGLMSLLSAEHKRGMNLSISDETIELISNVCKSMLSIDHFMDSDEYLTITEKHIIPLIIQFATNSSNDEALLTPLSLSLCKHSTQLSVDVHLAILKTLVDLKTCLGNTFDSSVRDNVTSFVEDCKLHDDERIADLANDVI